MDRADAALLHASYALLRDAIPRPCLRQISMNGFELGFVPVPQQLS